MRQAEIEAARSEASEERRRDRAQLEHYVEAGLDPDDAETLLEFQHMVEGQHPYEPREERGEALRRYRPRIYVADLASHAQGIRYGVLIGANQEPEKLDAAITKMLDDSLVAHARAWAVTGTAGFAGLDLHGFTDTTLIAELARGVTEHGAAYAAWVGMVGTEDRDQLSRFDDFYVGSYDTPEAWAREVADDLSWPEQLDREITDPFLRRYVEIDYAKVAREGAESWDLLTGSDGRTHVFLR
jgi:antirestriction protein